MAEEFIEAAGSGDFDRVVELSRGDPLDYYVLNDAHKLACENQHAETADLLAFMLTGPAREWRKKPRDELNEVVADGDFEQVAEAFNERDYYIETLLRARECAYRTDNEDIVDFINTKVAEKLVWNATFGMVSGGTSDVPTSRYVEKYLSPDFWNPKPKPPRVAPAEPTECKMS